MSYRAIWINEGAEVGDYERLRQLGMTHVYWSERAHTVAHLQQARSKGFAVGLYTNPQWYGFSDPAELAFDLNRTLINKFAVKAVEQCDVQINYERHDGDYIVRYITAWRKVRKTRMTYWTMEGHQAGWAWQAMNHPALLGDLSNPRTTTMLSPQAYDGSMNRWDSWGIVKDLIDYGVRPLRIFPFYDAPEARIPYGDGFFYLENRL